MKTRELKKYQQIGKSTSKKVIIIIILYCSINLALTLTWVISSFLHGQIFSFGSCRVPKKLWNMKVTVILIMTVTSNMENKLEIRKRIKTIQTTVLLILVRIFKRVQEIRGNLLSFRLQ